MRKHLMNSFSEAYIINLHGNVRKKETAPGGKKDENVFDIMQGVSINIFVSKKDRANSNHFRIFSYDIYGERSEKYKILQESTLGSIPFKELFPTAPYYFFVPKDFSDTEIYDEGISLKDLFTLYNSGIQTKRDKLTVAFDKEKIETVLSDFRSKDARQLREEYNLPADGRDWTIPNAQNDIIKNNPIVISYLYRPFDFRYSAYTGISRGFIGYPRNIVMKHFLKKNIGLLTTRSHSSDSFQHVLATDCISDIHAVSDQTYVFPLFLYSSPDIFGNTKKPNLNKEKVKELLSKTDYKYRENEEDAIKVFSYIYGKLHSIQYRKNNKEMLKIDFPKIPKPYNTDYFNNIANKGEMLLRAHLGIDKIDNTIEFVGNDRVVSKVRYKDSRRVYINKTSFFEGITDNEWTFIIGSYSPIQHWFKDRKGTELSDKDIEAVVNMVSIIHRTINIMMSIDSTIS